ncbi:MAG TPA: sugar phosphate isomerase/epimerase family protein [Verrucomicrobiae bacterium]|nr:sugar phosphate isomerase/epimerase family protein [Verrucomicrobiae bacterium]
MKRRDFLAACGALAVIGAAPKSFIVTPSKMKLGTVTYNLAKDWDNETIIKNCEEAKFQGVELRTTHAHKVEVNLTAPQREVVRKRFKDSNVELMGLGSAFDYHTPDQTQLRKAIEASKEYIKLAHDVGASGVKVRPNAFPKDVPQERTLEQIGKSLREIGEFGDSHGVQIRLEVHGSGTSLLPNIKRMIDIANHANVGVCWNSNPTDLEGDGFDYNFDLVKSKIFTVHLRDLYIEDYPFRRLFKRLNDISYTGYCLAEMPDSKDPVRVMKYFRSLFLAYQDLL